MLMHRGSSLSHLTRKSNADALRGGARRFHTCCAPVKSWMPPEEFPLEFRSGFLQTTPMMLPLFSVILATNTVGFVFDALRLFNAI